MTNRFLLFFALVGVLCVGLVSSGRSDEKQAAKAGLTTTVVKEFVTRKEKALATGVGSAHKSVTLTFQNPRFGASRAVTKRDKLNGIKGTTVYPVRVRYTSHRVWGNGETEDKEIHFEYEFFKDAFGEWDAYGVGPVQ